LHCSASVLLFCREARLAPSDTCLKVESSTSQTFARSQWPRFFLSNGRWGNWPGIDPLRLKCGPSFWSQSEANSKWWCQSSSVRYCSCQFNGVSFWITMAAWIKMGLDWKSHSCWAVYIA
jgi:hypothetical protein